MAEFLSSDPKVQDTHPHSVYDLIANICHDGQPGKGLNSATVLSCIYLMITDRGTYRVHIRHKVSDKYDHLVFFSIYSLVLVTGGLVGFTVFIPGSVCFCHMHTYC